jgi:1,4-alpha-glucan branching enzyme
VITEDLKMKVRRERKKTNDKSVHQETVQNGRMVEFSLQAPEAKEVFLAGEFNQWDAQSMPMKRGKDGNWKVKKALPPGRYEYKFFLDKQWVEGLPGTELVPNHFGTQNCVLRVE